MEKETIRIRLQAEANIEPNERLNKIISENEGQTIELDDETKEMFFDMMRKTKVNITFGKEVL